MMCELIALYIIHVTVFKLIYMKYETANKNKLKNNNNNNNNNNHTSNYQHTHAYSIYFIFKISNTTYICSTYFIQ